MSTFSQQLSTTADDSYSTSPSSWGSGTQPLRFGKASSTVYHGYFRWTNVTIANAATISAATITFTSSVTGCTASVIKVGMEAADNPAAPTTYSDANGRSYTTNTVSWSTSCPSVDTTETTPDFSSSVQDVVNRAGWASGQAMHSLVRDNGSSGALAHHRVYDVSGGEPTKTASISITYTAPSTGHPAAKRMGGVQYAALNRGVW